MVHVHGTVHTRAWAGIGLAIHNNNIIFINYFLAEKYEKANSMEKLLDLPAEGLLYVGDFSYGVFWFFFLDFLRLKTPFLKYSSYSALMVQNPPFPGSSLSLGT